MTREEWDALEAAILTAEVVYRENKQNGEHPLSTAYDEGRVAGLKEAAEILQVAASRRPSDGG